MCPCFFPCHFLFWTRWHSHTQGQAVFCSGSLSSFRRMSILAISTSGPLGRSWPFLTCTHTHNQVSQQRLTLGERNQQGFNHFHPGRRDAIIDRVGVTPVYYRFDAWLRLPVTAASCGRVLLLPELFCFRWSDSNQMEVGLRAADSARLPFMLELLELDKHRCCINSGWLHSSAAWSHWDNDNEAAGGKKRLHKLRSQTNCTFLKFYSFEMNFPHNDETSHWNTQQYYL